MREARRDLLSGLVLCLFSVAFYWAIVAGTRPVARVRGRAIDVVGEMGFPTALAILIGLGGLAVLAGAVLAMRRRGEPLWPGFGRPAADVAPAEAAPEEGIGRSFALIAIVVAFVVLLPLLGYLVAMPLFLVAGLWANGYRRWLISVAFAVGFTAATYAGFAYALGVILPSSSLF